MPVVCSTIAKPTIFGDARDLPATGRSPDWQGDFQPATIVRRVSAIFGGGLFLARLSAVQRGSRRPIMVATLGSGQAAGSPAEACHSPSTVNPVR